MLPGWMDKSTEMNEKGQKAFRERNAFNIYAPRLWDLDKMSPTDAANVKPMEMDALLRTETAVIDPVMRPPPLNAPKNAEEAERLLLACVLIHKHNLYVDSRKAAKHVHGALFVSGILSSAVFAALPHPL